VHVNAYHQPGVEAGKRILQLQPGAGATLENGGEAEAIAQAIGAEPEDVYHVLPSRGEQFIHPNGAGPGRSIFADREALLRA
jgi:hypothetical protein